MTTNESGNYIIDLSRKMVNHALQTTRLVHDQADKLYDTFWTVGASMSKDSYFNMGDWFQEYYKGMAAYRKVIDENCSVLAQFFPFNITKH